MILPLTTHSTVKFVLIQTKIMLPPLTTHSIVKYVLKQAKMMLPLTTHSIVKYVLKQAKMMLLPHYTFHSKVCTETSQNDATPSLHIPQ